MSDVALVNRPFGTTTRPAIGISLLKAGLARDAISCDLHYLNLVYAQRIGIERYEHVCNVNDTLLAEYVFAKLVFGDRIPSSEVYVADVFAPTARIGVGESSSPEDRLEALSSLVGLLIEHATLFLDWCMESIVWDRYALVGFTTTFHQTMASIALATRIKLRQPSVQIVFGGANCESSMGLALHRLFPVIDFVCAGEGDLSFPMLVKSLLNGRCSDDIPGILRRENGKTMAPTHSGAPVEDMDALPNPDYDDYVKQRVRVLGSAEPPELLLETARGCWWGRKSHCTFCGLNGETMQFRAKSSERAYSDIVEMVRRYGTSRIASVDNIIAMKYFHDLLPALAALGAELDLFYETKANLKRGQVKLLREAGVLRIQPGIESLSTPILRLMKKGVSSLQNIQLLRWCAEFMIEVHWNLLAGFPGETSAEYERQSRMVPLLVHLTPPLDCGILRLDRFSPLFVGGEQSGVRNIRPRKAYGYTFPFEAQDLFDLAYFFDFDYIDDRDPAAYIAELQARVLQWRSVHAGAALLSLAFQDRLVLWDTRPGAASREQWLSGVDRLVYEFCDEARTRDAINRHVAAAPGLSNRERCAVDEAIDDLAARRLLLHEDDRWLSLGVAADYQVDVLGSHVASGKPAPPRTQAALSRLYAVAPDVVRGVIAARLDGRATEHREAASGVASSLANEEAQRRLRVLQ